MVPAMRKGVPDNLVIEEFMLPAQLTWSWRRPLNPGRRLVFAVLWTALFNLATHRFAKRQRKQRLYWQAWEWVASSDHDSEFAFERLCEEFRIDAAGARTTLLDVRQPIVDLARVEESEADTKRLATNGFDDAA